MDGPMVVSVGASSETTWVWYECGLDVTSSGICKREREWGSERPRGAAGGDKGGDWANTTLTTESRSARSRSADPGTLIENKNNIRAPFKSWSAPNMDIPFTMFHSHSPYSPFFTSGLFSARAQDVPTSPRRGSLPTDTPASRDAAATEDVSAFYFTLQARRDEDEFRSFLSLDLAESQSMRSASLKRKASASTNGRAARSTRTLSKPSEKLFRFPYAAFSLCFARLCSPFVQTHLRGAFTHARLRTRPAAYALLARLLAYHSFSQARALHYPA
jgi:hypothetical protein